MFLEIIALCAAVFGGEVSGEVLGMVGPEFDEKGYLKRPEGYRAWVHVGTTLGPVNAPFDPGPHPGFFHEVYMQPEAYAYYVEHGRFPEKTIMVMENYLPEDKERKSVSLRGFIEKELIGVEVSVLDSERFEGRWGFFDFSTREQKLLDRAFRKVHFECLGCHAFHNDEPDPVFARFYPLLRHAGKSGVRSPKSGAREGRRSDVEGRETGVVEAERSGEETETVSR